MDLDGAAGRRYLRTPEYAAAQTALARVQANFAAHNPGYSLYSNTEVRNLDLQLERYNHNTSVGNVAQAIVSDAASACARAPDKFAAWLAAWRPPVAANLAAPGRRRTAGACVRLPDLSGQHACCRHRFRPHRSGVGGTRMGCAVGAAIHEAGPNFTGPLQSPNEPWHYTYQSARR